MRVIAESGFLFITSSTVSLETQKGITTMTYSQAHALNNQIKSVHPSLLPSVHRLDGGEYIIVFQQRQYRKTVAFWHCWQPSDYYHYLESLSSKSREKVAS